MATMFPADVTSFLTTGEEATYSFLQRTARPDGKFLCWYAPDIEEREPDFILLSPDCGLVVLEVKDWLIDQLLEVDGKSVLLSVNGREERRKQAAFGPGAGICGQPAHPVEQARAPHGGRQAFAALSRHRRGGVAAHQP